MARIDKERQAYMAGMAFAYKVAKEQGVEGLEKEIQFRGIANLPLNVSAKELTDVVRKHAQNEVMVMVTASAATLTEFIKLPPSRVLEFLKEFKRRAMEYRADPVAYQKAQDRMNRNSGLNEVCRLYEEGEKGNE